MNPFYFSAQTPPSSQLKTGSEEAGKALSIQSSKLYSARLEMLGNQLSQVKVAVGKQTITVPLPPQQLPPGIKLDQPLQVSFSITKNGQQQIRFFAQGSAPSVTSSTSSAQTVKISLTDAQLVNLLTLGKAFKANPDGRVQTQGKIVMINQNTPALKLPGLTNAIKLPEGLADLAKDAKAVGVTISAKGNKIELQLSLDPKNPKATQFNLPLSADKVTQMVKQSISQTSNMAVKVDSKSVSPAGTTKITLANQQQLSLPTKVAANADVKVQALSQHELTIKVTPIIAQSEKALAAIILKQPMPLLSEDQINAKVSAKADTKAAAAIILKQPMPLLSEDQINAKVSAKADTKAAEGSKTATSTSTHPLNKAAASFKPAIDSLIQAVKLTAEKSLVGPTDQPQVKQPLPPRVDLKQQKQILDKLIDPLIRILLPKKINLSEGLKTLAALEQQLPDTKPAADGSKDPQLKQLLNQINNSIIDQNTPLTEKNMATIISQLLNVNPARVSPTVQSTPANAIANALQLLLGSKLVQRSEAKVTPQLLQQLTSLLKPLTNKEAKTPSAMKALTASMTQTEQGGNSLKTLVGLQSGIRHQQLENVEKKLDGNPQINVNMPLKLDDEIKEVKIAISEEQRNNSGSANKKSIWQLNLTFDLGEMGKLLVNAKLKEGEVSMHLYAEQQHTLTLMERFSSILEKRLETQGVKINNIQSSLGKINTPKGSKPLNSILQITV
ncbi:MAG: hypothetical protein ACI9FJ_000698 [Alteromonadaceae bacterium]|jgi:hypothetical protein